MVKRKCAECYPNPSGIVTVRCDFTGESVATDDVWHCPRSKDSPGPYANPNANSNPDANPSANRNSRSLSLCERATLTLTLHKYLTLSVACPKDAHVHPFGHNVGVANTTEYRDYQYRPTPTP